MSLENSEPVEPAELAVSAEAPAMPATALRPETPRKRYAAPSAPRVMKCTLPVTA